jgi:hypothetical protein
MSDLDNLLKYVIAEAEHGEVKFMRLTYKPGERELRNFLSMYPFIIEGKIRLYCAPPENPMSCSMSADVESFMCQRVTQTKVSCYSPVTGHVYSDATSKKIMESLRVAYALCVGRLRRTLDQIGASSVPPQNKPEGEPEDKFKELLQGVKQKTGIPTDQGIVKTPRSQVKLREDLPWLSPCYEIARITDVPGFVEALNQHDFTKAKSFILEVVAELAVNNTLESLLGTVKECSKLLSERR